MAASCSCRRRGTAPRASCMLWISVCVVHSSHADAPTVLMVSASACHHWATSDPSTIVLQPPYYRLQKQILCRYILSLSRNLRAEIILWCSPFVYCVHRSCAFCMEACLVVLVNSVRSNRSISFHVALSRPLRYVPSHLHNLQMVL